MPAGEVTQGSPWRRRSAVRSGLVTGVAAIVLAGSGAAAGALLAQKFGRNARTDGLLAAYAVYLVLTLAAQSFRLVVVPDLTRAAHEGLLAGEARAYGIAFLALAVPVCALVGTFSGPLGELITGRLPPSSAHVASGALVWLVPAGFAQLLAALAASVLAARDSYATAAAGFAGGGVAGLLFFAALAGGHGVIALAWGLALNGAVAVCVPLARLVRERVLVGPGGRVDVGRRLWRLVQGAAVPVALQGFYVVALRAAGALGVGRVSSFSYAYILAAMFVTATAFSLGIVSSAPLTRRGLTASGVAEHLLHGLWVSLAAIGAAAGVFALVGGRLAELVLGHAYAGNVGHELGRLVVYLAPWMVVSAAFSILFPLLHVLGRRRVLLPVALLGVAVDIPVTIGLRAAADLAGLAVALFIATAVVVAVLLAAISTEALVVVGVGLLRLAAIVGTATTASFGLPALGLPAPAAAAVGLILYAVVLTTTLRPLGLQKAWAYVRTLH
jgi:hypothetical protein